MITLVQFHRRAAVACVMACGNPLVGSRIIGSTEPRPLQVAIPGDAEMAVVYGDGRFMLWRGPFRPAEAHAWQWMPSWKNEMTPIMWLPTQYDSLVVNG